MQYDHIMQIQRWFSHTDIVIIILYLCVVRDTSGCMIVYNYVPSDLTVLLIKIFVSIYTNIQFVIILLIDSRIENIRWKNSC